MFQVPGGIFAAKIGPRKTTFCGAMLFSTAVLLCATSTEIYEIALLRFVAGIGMAFEFGPGITLIAKYFRKGNEGLGVGLSNAAYYVGGALGLFGWAYLGQLVGWRVSLALSGVLGILSGVLILLWMPIDNMRTMFELTKIGIRRVVTDSWLIVLGIELLGITVGTSLIGNFMVFYLEDRMGISPSLAGIIGSLSLFLSLLASPIFGRAYDRRGNVSKLLFLSGITTVIGIAVAAIPTLVGPILSVIIVGLGSGAANTVGFSAAREGKKRYREYDTLAVSWVNSLSLSAAFWSPVVFSFVVVSVGYFYAWLTASLYTILLVVPILVFKKE